MEQTREPAQAGSPDAVNRKRKPLGRTIGILAAAVVILAALGAAGYGMVRYPHITATLRDISVIVLALVTAIIGLFLIVLVFQIQSLVALLRDEVKPLLDSANRTASTVRGTTTFVSDAVISPMITVASYASAVGQTLRVLAGHGRKRAKDGRSAQDRVE